ncbi:hypothetical protein KIQ_002120 [Corynebacterium glutamicum ATCC 14067]|uniref:LGFP repeat-containing protein n=1 Tax=Corynebacterium TaxID=1716 RepID=UPI000231B8EC|nr:MULTISPECIES: LGFP repeat-containing protein [Corynebacterium]AST21844.1 hypothetical protein CEY17_14470 [Corynebacterium glutamicum ATCC 14067]KEI24382.1 hypothetical protein KIQ_002120 [Corynebacterium glutamicum ATCC 14067]QJS16988.1 hypothetical protein HK412_12465 [Corynebacterium glutamicum]QXU45511.1 LGFP repeat-containing protein [[Brevibacterium] flavum]
MKLFSKAAGVIAAALLVTGGIAPVAQGQALQVVTPEDQESYVQQFHHDGDTPPVVDGVGGYTEEEIAEIHEAIRQAQDSGAPNDELIPGQMWSDKVELPATIDKAAADEAEIAIAQQQSQPQARGLAAAAACQTFWPSPYQVCGAILERYIQQGSQFGWMLLPTEGQALNPDGQGYRQRFMAGFIYWHPSTGAHAVNNYSAQVWERNGWESGWMGYPTGGEVPVSGSNPIDGELNGWVQTFQGGRVYRSPVVDGFQVASINGLILDRWLELGGPESDLGFPIADEAVTADGVGRFGLFQSGAIYWHPNYGAHAVDGAVFQVWKQEGAENGPRGYPISDVYLDSDSNVRQDFSNQSLNLGDYFTSNQLVLVGDREVSLDYLNFLEEFLGIEIPPGSSATTQVEPMLRTTQLWDPLENSTWSYKGRVWRIVSPVRIPVNYVYDTNHPERRLHDFCSVSQDLWGEDTQNFNHTDRVADFRGPCATHDICYDQNRDYSTRADSCDPNLRRDLKTACREAYGTSVTRGYCWSIAEGMYQVVKGYQRFANGGN